MVGVDGTTKNALDGFERRWPDDVDCTLSVVESTKEQRRVGFEPKYV